MVLTKTQAVEVITQLHGGVRNDLAEFGALHAATCCFATVLAIEMRVLEPESSMETKKPVDAVLAALDLKGPGSSMLKALVVLIEDFLLDLALGCTKKATAGVVEEAMKFGPETAACRIKRA